MFPDSAAEGRGGGGTTFVSAIHTAHTTPPSPPGCQAFPRCPLLSPCLPRGTSARRRRRRSRREGLRWGGRGGRERGRQWWEGGVERKKGGGVGWGGRERDTEWISGTQIEFSSSRRLGRSSRPFLPFPLTFLLLRRLVEGEHQRDDGRDLQDD